MEENKEDSTETKILEAATNVFLRKGMEGARMQEIADEAGINKALLHYYFRTKDRLFEAVFSELIQYAFPKLAQIIKSELSFVEKLDLGIDLYMSVLQKNHFLPVFVLKEINRDPSGLIKMAKKLGLNPRVLTNELQNAMDRGEIVSMDPVHLLINLVSMCIFPFVSKPIINHLVFKDNKEALDAFYAQRAAEIKEFVRRAIVINTTS